MKIFREIAHLEHAIALGALQPGDCVCVDPSRLQSLGDEVRSRLARDLAAVGARLCEDGTPLAAVVYSAGERRPRECDRPSVGSAPRAAPSSPAWYSAPDSG